MADVRGLVQSFYAVVLLGVATLVVAGVASRGSRAFWRAVALGAKILAIGAIAAGAAFLLFFDAAFTLFHQIFFAEGSWTFDPATERLVQLFPYGFWTETTVVLAIVGLVITVGVWLVAARLSRPPREPAAPAAAVAGGDDAS
jgi:integral membrane protein (TIGR01906 family)